MNISRDAFYRLVKMQNLLNDIRNETSSFSDDLKREIWAIDELSENLQYLTSKYLKDVEHNREISAERPTQYETETFRWAQKAGLI